MSIIPSPKKDKKSNNWVSWVHPATFEINLIFHFFEIYIEIKSGLFDAKKIVEM